MTQPDKAALAERITNLQKALDAECTQKYKHVAEILDLKGQIAALRSDTGMREALEEAIPCLIEQGYIPQADRCRAALAQSALEDK